MPVHMCPLCFPELPDHYQLTARLTIQLNTGGACPPIDPDYQIDALFDATDISETVVLSFTVPGDRSNWMTYGTGPAESNNPEWVSAYGIYGWGFITPVYPTGDAWFFIQWDGVAGKWKAYVGVKVYDIGIYRLDETITLNGPATTNTSPVGSYDDYDNCFTFTTPQGTFSLKLKIENMVVS